MHPLQRAQIAHLKANKTLIEISNKYADFVNVFSSKLVVKLSKHMGINNHAIEFVND